MRVYDDDYFRGPRSGRYSDGYSDGRYGKQYPGNDNYGEKDGGFPFRTLRSLGWAMLILAIIVLMLGVIDVGWTAGNYIGATCTATTQNFDKSFLKVPCDHESLIWTWVAAPIWASFFIIITGIIGTRFSSWRSTNLKFHRDLFAIMCVLVCLIWGPVIIIIASLEVVYGKDVFYYMNTAQAMQFGDMAKVILPLLIIAFTFFLWIAAIIGAVTSCCCAPIADYGYGSLGRNYIMGGSDVEIVPYKTRRDYDSFPRRSMRSFRSAPPITSNIMSSRGGASMGPPIILPPTQAPTYSSFPGYATYGGMRSGYTNNAYTPTFASNYGGGGGYYGGGGGYTTGGYSGLTNALMPYTGNYGGATYGGYGSRAIASNPYI